MKHWVIVADAGSCRIYQTDESMSSLLPVWSQENAHAHLPAADLVSGRQGRTRSGPGGQHAALERHTDPIDAEHQRFAAVIAHHVDHAHATGEWERAILVAPPRFLGQLRGTLGSRTMSGVVASIDKDWTKLPEHRLADEVRSHLPDLAGYGR